MTDREQSPSRMTQMYPSEDRLANSQEREEPSTVKSINKDRSTNSNHETSTNETRRRSRSPRRDKPRRKDAGFKWKEKRRDDDEGANRDEGLRRGYRDQYRPRSRSHSPRRRSGREDESSERRRERDEPLERQDRKEKKEKREKKSIPAMPQQEMIIVYVNDRLGTKKAIPCFPTDPIKDFKVIVASMIGRQPHEILLKRQGERPFKDQLTLQDYGVSNNVQLDLEVDTGD